MAKPPSRTSFWGVHSASVCVWFLATLAHHATTLVLRILLDNLCLCLQEEELAVIRRRQATFARERDAEMAEVQRMEAEAKRKSAEK